LFVGAGGSVNTSTFQVTPGSIGFSVTGGTIGLLLVPATTTPVAAATYAFAASNVTVSLIGLPAGFTLQVDSVVSNPTGGDYTAFNAALKPGLLLEADGKLALDGGGFVE